MIKLVPNNVKKSSFLLLFYPRSLTLCPFLFFEVLNYCSFKNFVYYYKVFIFIHRMYSCRNLKIRFRNKPIESGHQFSFHSDFIQESNKPASIVHGIYPDRDCVG